MNFTLVCLKRASGALSRALRAGRCWSPFRFCVVTGATLPHCRFLCRRFDHIAGRDEEAAYLSGLKTLWRGLIHMHAVAKLVTKAFPVSGIMDNLNEVTTWTKTAPRTRACQQALTLFCFLLGPSRQHSCWRKDQSTDCVGLLGEDSSNWHKSTFQQVSKS